jgi:hypothetical protein
MPTHTAIRSHRLHLSSETRVTAVRQGLPTYSYSIYGTKRSRVRGSDNRSAGAPCAPQLCCKLGTASAELSTALPAQRSGSARVAASGPVACFQQGFKGFFASKAASNLLCQLRLVLFLPASTSPPQRKTSAQSAVNMANITCRL